MKLYFHLFNLIYLLSFLNSNQFRIDDFSFQQYQNENFLIDKNISSFSQFPEQLTTQYKASENIILQHTFSKPDQLLFDSSRILWEKGIIQEAPYFLGKDSYLILPNWGEYFQNGNLSSFTLEFYFYPTTPRKEILFKGSDVNLINNKLVPVEFIFAIDKEKLIWQGINFFHFNQKHLSISLTSTKKVNYYSWNKLSLTYNSRNGRIELYLNNEITDFTYTTTDGTQNSTIYHPRFINQNIAPSMVLGENFIGKIDVITLSRGVKSLSNSFPILSVYSSKVFSIKPFSRIENITIKGENIFPKHLEIYLCSDLNYFFEINKYFQCPKVPWINWNEKNPIVINQIKNLIKKNKIIANYFQLFLVYHTLELPGNKPIQPNQPNHANINWVEFDYQIPTN